MEHISFSLGLITSHPDKRQPQSSQPMSHHIPHVPDTIVVLATTSSVAASRLVLNYPDTMSAEAAFEMNLFLLPLLGALLFAGAMVMLNPNVETRRITIGRGIISVFFGVLAPQVLAMIHPSLAAISVKPFMLTLIGGLVAGLSYALSRPFVSQLYARSERIAAREADRLESRYSPPGKDDKPKP